jgi:hypothetical protein
MVIFAASTAFPSELAYLLNTKVLTSSTSSPDCTGTEVAVKPGSHTHSLRCGLGDNIEWIYKRDPRREGRTWSPILLACVALSRYTC